MKFKKLLIANRGEITQRIARSAKQCNLSTVCIYSGSDKSSAWIHSCDESRSLGNGSISETYLSIDKIIDIAKNTGADCIHPGYGFLSENHLFAEACAHENIAFIGPSPEVLKLAGNKPAAIDYVRKLNIPVPEGRKGKKNELLSLALELHYPLMVKANAGGGGKGMRLVHSPGELSSALKAASGEALNYFGDDGVYLEQYIDKARHVEVQILGDHQGNIIHLFDRDCTIQRRNQKVIEEAPVTFLPVDKRHEIMNAALLIAQSLNYSSAGTIEFLVDENGNYFFLEINPRLQVEHAVTELVTGTDIVKEQLSIAAGNPIGFKNISVKGHALEARIYAEDPLNNFLPSPGYLSVFNIPGDFNVRIETSFTCSSEIPGNYDPLLAKVIVHEADRDVAISTMENVLHNTRITGCRHNTPILKALMHHEGFRQNDINTRFLENHLGELLEKAYLPTAEYQQCIVAAGAMKILAKRNPQISRGYWRNSRQLRLRFNREIVEIMYSKRSSGYELFIGNHYFFAGKSRQNDNQVTLTFGEKDLVFYYGLENDAEILVNDGHFEYTIKKFILSADSGQNGLDESHASAADVVVAPQPGLILDIRVEEGQMVNRGDDLLVIESMKLENTILAGRRGTIKKIAIKTGDRVKKNELLILLQETNN